MGADLPSQLGALGWRCQPQCRYMPRSVAWSCCQDGADCGTGWPTLGHHSFHSQDISLPSWGADKPAQTLYKYVNLFIGHPGLSIFHPVRPPSLDHSFSKPWSVSLQLTVPFPGPSHRAHGMIASNAPTLSELILPRQVRESKKADLLPWLGNTKKVQTPCCEKVNTWKWRHLWSQP